MTTPERVCSPGYHCDHCESHADCDIGGCVYENDAIDEALKQEQKDERASEGKPE